ncbi:MAG TPA: hypothetical protein PLY35_09510 [Thermotogota bacterium]|nr:hypothetical protein [Thermotogota bacterium]
MKLKELRTEGLLDFILKLFDKPVDNPDSYKSMKRDFQKNYSKIKQTRDDIDKLKATLKSNPEAMEYIKKYNLEKLLEL